MNLASDRLHRARDKLAAMQVNLRHRLQSDGEPDADHDDEPAASELSVPATVDLARAPMMIETGDRDDVNRAVGWLLTAPTLPEDVAEATMQACLARLDDEAFSIERLAYRGISAVGEHHPALVEPHVQTVARGLGERYVVVRDACATLLVESCRRDPRLTGAVYPYLLSEHDPTRTAAFGVVVDVGRAHPVVLCSIDPFLRDQLATPSVPRPQLVDAYLCCSERDPAVLGEAIPHLIDWLPTTDRDLEEAIVRAVTTWGDVPAEGGDLIVRTCLSYLSARDRPHRLAASRWVVDAVTTEPDLGSVIEAWRYDTDEWERLRVAAAIQEGTEDGLAVVGEQLVRGDDTFAADLGIESGPPDEDQ